MATLCFGRFRAAAATLFVLMLLAWTLPVTQSRRQLITRRPQQQQQRRATFAAFAVPPAHPTQSDDLRLTTPAASVDPTGKPEHSAALPVFFFHGVLSNAKSGYRFAANLTGEGRVFVPLSFCDDSCSVQALETQVQLAITQIRAIVQLDPMTYQHGYVFVGHSQGGAIARAVVEAMDDHNVQTLISLAGVVNGVFFGPQREDQLALLVFLKYLDPRLVPVSIWDPSVYGPQDLNGTLQRDWDVFVRAHPELQLQYSAFNLARSPVPDATWLATNTFLPIVNNLVMCRDLGERNAIAQCEREQARRRHNFMRLRAAHFFASPADGVVAPWQSSVFGQYSELESIDEIASAFESLHVLAMTDTVEYVRDTYGLQTLDKRGGLHLHVVEGVPHTCWVTDAAPFGSVHPCFFDEIYDKHIYATL